MENKLGLLEGRKTEGNKTGEGHSEVQINIILDVKYGLI